MQQIVQGNIGADDTLKWIARHAAWKEIKRDSYYWQFPDLYNFADSTDNANMGSLSRLDSLINDTLIGISSQAYNNLQGITPSNNREENMQDVLKVVFEKELFNQIVFTPQQKQKLQDIAWRCPLRDGIAVYQARVLLSQIDNTFYLNECELDMEAEPRSNMFDEEENIIENNILFSISPNPANTQITLTLLSEIETEEQEAVVVVFNGLGQVVEKTKLVLSNNFMLNINVNNYNNGVYLIQVNSKNNESILFIDKFIIQH